MRGQEEGASSLTPQVTVFFAVQQEARSFHPPTGVTAVVTGMGPRNSLRAAAKAIETARPEAVLTCGFAGGLDPELRLGQVIFDADKGFSLSNALVTEGAKPIRFHCAERVAVTRMDKSTLRARTRADAVEMESAVIRDLCHAQGIPSATVRVISDPAQMDLPLDFNALMTPDFRLDGTKLALRLLRSPSLVPKMMRFHRQVAFASRRLGQLLTKVFAEH